MSRIDRESMQLLQLSDSDTDSVPDLDLVVTNTAKKKKVRVKRLVILNNPYFTSVIRAGSDSLIIAVRAEDSLGQCIGIGSNT